MRSLNAGWSMLTTRRRVIQLPDCCSVVTSIRRVMPAMRMLTASRRLGRSAGKSHFRELPVTVKCSCTGLPGTDSLNCESVCLTDSWTPQYIGLGQVSLRQKSKQKVLAKGLSWTQKFFSKQEFSWAKSLRPFVRLNDALPEWLLNGLDRTRHIRLNV